MLVGGGLEVALDVPHVLVVLPLDREGGHPPSLERPPLLLQVLLQPVYPRLVVIGQLAPGGKWI